MRKILLTICVLSTLMYANPSELFQQAQQLEKQNDKDGAIRLYKEAFQLLNSQKKEIKNAIENDETPPLRISEKKIRKSKSIDEILELQAYRLNYLLPTTFSTSHFPDKRSRFETKFQISLVKPLAYDVFGLKESINFAYTQTSWWQTSRLSSPFRETNYEPELFVNIPLPYKNLRDFQFGVWHTSNGRGGTLSRSLNRVYIQSKFQVANLSIVPRFWALIGDLSDNRDVADYIGYADLNLNLKYNKQIFDIMLRNNLKFNHNNKGAVDFKWLFPIGANGLYGIISYFNGYAESLIDYNRSLQKFGLGFAILK